MSHESLAKPRLAVYRRLDIQTSNKCGCYAFQAWRNIQSLLSFPQPFFLFKFLQQPFDAFFDTSDPPFSLLKSKSHASPDKRICKNANFSFPGPSTRAYQNVATRLKHYRLNVAAASQQCVIHAAISCINAADVRREMGGGDGQVGWCEGSGGVGMDWA